MCHVYGFKSCIVLNRLIAIVVVVVAALFAMRKTNLQNTKTNHAKKCTTYTIFNFRLSQTCSLQSC